MSEISKEVGERIRTLRKGRQLTQDELAHRSGLGKNTFIRIESGGNTTIEKLDEIAKAMNISITSLFPVEYSVVVSADDFNNLRKDYQELQVKHENLVRALRDLIT